MVVDLKIEMAMLEDDFFDELDEIIEDTMISIFMLHPKSLEEIEKAKELSHEYNAIFYALPWDMLELHKDENCKALTSDQPLSLLELNALELPLLISAELMDESFTAILAQSSAKGAILNAGKNYGVPNFFEAMTLKKLLTFTQEEQEAIDMTHIVLHSNYPHQPLESINETAKLISDAIFRPDESIKNNATRNSLSLLGLR